VGHAPRTNGGICSARLPVNGHTKASTADVHLAVSANEVLTEAGVLNAKRFKVAQPARAIKVDINEVHDLEAFSVKIIEEIREGRHAKRTAA
jgi:hypothetical protein